MHVDRIKRIFHVLLRRLTRRQYPAIQQGFRRRRMFACPRLHRRGPDFLAVVELIVLRRVAPAKAPAGEGFCESLDHSLIIGRYRCAVGILHRRAVRIQLDQTDREQLQYFPGVVFIRMGALGRVLLFGLKHVQVITHCRMQRHTFENRAVVIERMTIERVHIGRHRHRVQVRCDVRDHEYLRECKGDTGTQLGFTVEPLLPDRFVAHFVTSFSVLFTRRLLGDVGDMRRCRDCELMAQPLFKSD